MSLPELPFAVRSAVAVSGGHLADAYRVECEDGRTVFVKASSDAAPGAFRAEAAGLAWIAAAPGAPPVPEVLAVGEGFLCLAWIEAGVRDDAALGRGLAALHRAGAERFGALAPGAPPDGLRLGPLVLARGEGGHGTFGRAGAHNSREPPGSWGDVYRDERLLPLMRQACARGALSASGRAAVESVCERLDDLCGPPEPPARLHGDLWGGNALGNHLIDPAAYGGHREVDLAMMALFGGFSDRVFAAYAEAFPLSEGWQDRVELWQLLPLLLHAVLFGGGYGRQVEVTARHYVG